MGRHHRSFAQFELEDDKLLNSPNLDYVPADEKMEFLEQVSLGRRPLSGRACGVYEGL